MIFVNQRIGCFAGIFQCFPEWTIVNHCLPSGLYIITIMGSLILDHSRKNDYNEFIKKYTRRKDYNYYEKNEKSICDILIISGVIDNSYI